MSKTDRRQREWNENEKMEIKPDKNPVARVAELDPQDIAMETAETFPQSSEVTVKPKNKVTLILTLIAVTSIVVFSIVISTFLWNSIKPAPKKNEAIVGTSTSSNVGNNPEATESKPDFDEAANFPTEEFEKILSESDKISGLSDEINKKIDSYKDADGMLLFKTQKDLDAFLVEIEKMKEQILDSKDIILLENDKMMEKLNSDN